jgi:hypothetical protein
MRTASSTTPTHLRTAVSKLAVAGALVAFGVVGATSPAAAAPELVVNGGFETAPIAPGSVSAATTSLPGWFVPQGDIDIVNWNGSGRWSAHSGQQSVDLNGCAMGAIKQKIVTVPGMVYDLSYWIAPSTQSPGMKRIGARVGTAPGRSDLANQITYRDSSTATPANMGWVNLKASFVATETFAWIYFDDYSQDGCFGMALDDVSVVARESAVVSVPQFDQTAVAVFAMAGCSLGWMASQRRRQRRVVA